MLLAQTTLAQTTGASSPEATLPITSASQPTLPVSLIHRLPACTADQLLISTDLENGNFNGMSHGGTLIILRNNGTQVCRILPLAQASLLDTDGKPLGPFSTTPPHAFGMHPGPVVLPVALAVNAELTATLFWVDGPVFSDNLCLKPAVLLLQLGELTLKTPLTGQLCGERSKGVTAELSRFTPDQVPVAAPAQ